MTHAPTPPSPLTVALPKGRLAEQALELLARAGAGVPELPPDSRKLVFDAPDGRLRFILVKPSDVPIYVEYGVADLGIAGKDTILESRADVYDVLDLKVGRCRMVVAGPRSSPGELSRRAFVRVATKYPRLTEQRFLAKGVTVEVIGLSGSVELAPVTGLAERIVDLVETGSTLAAHDLVELDVLFHSSARLVVNRASHKLRYEVLSPLVERLREVVG
jgi:ATP phosphoribosyltransferase